MGMGFKGRQGKVVGGGEEEECSRDGEQQEKMRGAKRWSNLLMEQPGGQCRWVRENLGAGGSVRYKKIEEVGGGSLWRDLNSKQRILYLLLEALEFVEKMSDVVRPVF